MPPNTSNFVPAVVMALLISPMSVFSPAKLLVSPVALDRNWSHAWFSPCTLVSASPVCAARAFMSLFRMPPTWSMAL